MSEPQKAFSLRSLVESVVKHLVDREDLVRVEENVNGNITVYTVKVADEDFGKLIGQGGGHASALRKLVKSMGRKHKVNAFVDVVDPQNRHFRDEPDRPPTGEHPRG